MKTNLCKTCSKHCNLLNQNITKCEDYQHISFCPNAMMPSSGKIKLKEDTKAFFSLLAIIIIIILGMIIIYFGIALLAKML
jgi:hypothetical protein